MSFSTALGESGVMKRSDLKSVPLSRAFKVTHVRADVTGAHWYAQPGGTTANPTPAAGGQVPAWVQLRIYNEFGTRAVATSGAVMVGPNPRSVTVNNTPGADWIPLEAPSTQTVLGIDSGCIMSSAPKTNIKAFVCGIIHLTVLLDVEESAEACPTLSSLHHFSEDFEVVGPPSGGSH